MIITCIGIGGAALGLLFIVALCRAASFGDQCMFPPGELGRAAKESASVTSIAEKVPDARASKLI